MLPILFSSLLILVHPLDIFSQEVKEWIYLDRLDELQKKWETDQKELKRGLIKFSHELHDSVLKEPKKRTGIFKFLRCEDGKLLARIDFWEQLANGEINKERPIESVICNRQKIMQLNYRHKEARMNEATEAKDVGLPVMEINIFGWKNIIDPVIEFPPFLWADGMQKLKNWNLKVVKMDQYYTYIQVLPKTKQDRRAFIAAECVILNAPHPRGQLPKDSMIQFSVKEPSHSVHTWKFESVWVNDEAKEYVEAKDFEKPVLPDGWKVIDTKQKP